MMDRDNLPKWYKREIVWLGVIIIVLIILGFVLK